MQCSGDGVYLPLIEPMWLRISGAEHLHIVANKNYIEAAEWVKLLVHEGFTFNQRDGLA